MVRFNQYKKQFKITYNQSKTSLELVQSNLQPV